MLPKNGNIAIGSPADTTVPRSPDPRWVTMVTRFGEQAAEFDMPYIDPIPELKRQVAAALVPLLQGNAHDVASLMRTDQPRVSDIRRGKLERFSLETLIRYLTRLRCRVELQITRERPSYQRSSSKPPAPPVA
jgi:predicted XRE-type DNA-binding protein